MSRVYEPTVECGCYCYGGSVKMEATEYPDEFCYVRYPDYQELLAALKDIESDADFGSVRDGLFTHIRDKARLAIAKAEAK
jgi:hypothetical protein